MITAGALILLYLAYSLWFTNTVAQANTQTLSSEFLAQVEKRLGDDSTTSDDVTTGIGESSTTAVEPTLGSRAFEPIGLVYIPRLRSDVWAEPLVSGISFSALASGIGHYPSTELPGEIGNFAIAGHRASNGEPFAYFERLRSGDRVYVQTLERWYEYTLVKDRIIQQGEVWVLSDSPADQGFEPGARLITLTTCDPRWNSYQRWAWWGELSATYPLDSPPEEVAQGR